jgi:hypothetical protein
MIAPGPVALRNWGNTICTPKGHPGGHATEPVAPFDRSGPPRCEGVRDVSSTDTWPGTWARGISPRTRWAAWPMVASVRWQAMWISDSYWPDPPTATDEQTIQAVADTIKARRLCAPRATFRVPGHAVNLAGPAARRVHNRGPGWPPAATVEALAHFPCCTARRLSTPGV